MHINNLRAVVILVITSFVVGCGHSKDTITVNSKQHDFTISLPANPTTGFQWSIVDYDKKLFDLVNHQYIASKVGMIGAGGSMLFTFNLNKLDTYPRKSAIKFKHARSWEPESAIYRTITVNIN